MLERGKPVAVTIVNQSDDHAAMHWHGIELESYPDGVPGWSGIGQEHPAVDRAARLAHRALDAAARGLVHVPLALQRSEADGQRAVRPDHRGRARASASIRKPTRSCSSVRPGTPRTSVFGPFPQFLMNGKAQPEAMNLKAGTRYRFRLFNLAGDAPLAVSINAGGAPVQWRAVAKDGYPLPASQATVAAGGADVRSGRDLRFRVYAVGRG